MSPTASYRHQGFPTRIHEEDARARLPARLLDSQSPQTVLKTAGPASTNVRQHPSKIETRLRHSALVRRRSPRFVMLGVVLLSGLLQPSHARSRNQTLSRPRMSLLSGFRSKVRSSVGSPSRFERFSHGSLHEVLQGEARLLQLPIAPDWPPVDGYGNRGPAVHYSHSNQHYKPLTVYMRYIAGLVVSANAEPAVLIGTAWPRAGRPLR